jgi:hypothetical protein
VTALFERVLGADAFARLPSCVRRLHSTASTRTYRGQCDIARGTGALAAFCCWCADLPRAASARPVEIEIAIDEAGETWTRDFGTSRMRSHLFDRDGRLCERLGLLRFEFGLDASATELAWRIRSVRIFGVPLPQRWFSQVIARESERDGHFQFDVRAELAGIGLLVHYCGYFRVD